MSEDLKAFYISFDKKPLLESSLNKLCNNISRFDAINGNKLDLDTLVKNKILDLSAYNSILNGYQENHTQIHTKGAIGCFLSHLELWKKLIEDKHVDRYLICEEDAIIDENNIEDIKQILHQIKDEVGGNYFANLGILGQSNISYNGKINIKSLSNYKYLKNNNRKHIFGSHGYVLDKIAAKKLLKVGLPISMHLDAYISYMGSILGINMYLSHKNYINQDNQRGSKIFHNICLNCYLPKNDNFYFILGSLIFIILLTMIIVGSVKIKCVKIPGIICLITIPSILLFLFIIFVIVRGTTISKN